MEREPAGAAAKCAVPFTEREAAEGWRGAWGLCEAGDGLASLLSTSSLDSDSDADVGGRGRRAVCVCV